MKTLFLAGLLFCINLWADEHREHEAHEHGSGVLTIAFDESHGRIEFKAAAQGVLGFEHVAQSASDKTVLASVIADIEKNMSAMVKMNPSLNCQFSKETVGMVVEKDHKGSGQHSNFVANFEVICAKSPIGTSIILDFTSLKKMKDIDVTVLVGDLQKSAELKMKPVKVDLK